MCCTEAHWYQQEVLHQLQAVVPEENLWQIDVSTYNLLRPPASKECGIHGWQLRVPPGLGQPSVRSGCQGAVAMHVQTCQGTVCFGSGSFSKLASFVLHF